MAREDVQRGTARQPPPACLRLRVRTTARWPWLQARGVESYGRRSIWAWGFHPSVAYADDALRRIDTEESCTELHIFRMCNGMPFSYFCRVFRVLVPTATGSERVCLRGRLWCWRWFGWWRMSNVRLSCLRCTLVRRQRTRGHTPRWMLCGGLLVTKRIIRHLPSTVTHFFPSLFLRREHGHPPRRDPGPAMMGAAGAECRPSRFRGRLDRSIIQLSCPSMIHLTLGLTTHGTAGHWNSIIMQKFSPLLPRLRQTILPFGAAAFHLALMPSEKTGGFASTATKTTIPSGIVGILSLLRVAA